MSINSLLGIAAVHRAGDSGAVFLGGDPIDMTTMTLRGPLRRLSLFATSSLVASSLLAGAGGVALTVFTPAAALGADVVCAPNPSGTAGVSGLETCSGAGDGITYVNAAGAVTVDLNGVTTTTNGVKVYAAGATPINIVSVTTASTIGSGGTGVDGRSDGNASIDFTGANVAVNATGIGIIAASLTGGGAGDSTASLGGGSVTATGVYGIIADAQGSGNASVTTGAGSTVVGSGIGVVSQAVGAGKATVDVGGSVTAPGGSSFGTATSLALGGGANSLTVESTGSVTSTSALAGVHQFSTAGNGAVTTTINGAVSNTSTGTAVLVRNSGTGLATITVGAAAPITGGSAGDCRRLRAEGPPPASQRARAGATKAW